MTARSTRRIAALSIALTGIAMLTSSCALLEWGERDETSATCALEKDWWFFYECEGTCVQAGDTCTLQYRKKDSEDPWQDHEGSRFRRSTEEYRCVCK